MGSLEINPHKHKQSYMCHINT